MSQYISIIDTHNKIIKVIPKNQIKLITDLSNFIKKLDTTQEKYLICKSIYVSYLHILLQHIPKRQLKNSDPEWMWNCQYIFSSSTI
jgi:hypothetical protein